MKSLSFSILMQITFKICNHIPPDSSEKTAAATPIFSLNSGAKSHQFSPSYLFSKLTIETHLLSKIYNLLISILLLPPPKLRQHTPPHNTALPRSLWKNWPNAHPIVVQPPMQQSASRRWPNSNGQLAATHASLGSRKWDDKFFMIFKLLSSWDWFGTWWDKWKKETNER